MLWGFVDLLQSYIFSTSEDSKAEQLFLSAPILSVSHLFSPLNGFVGLLIFFLICSHDTCIFCGHCNRFLGVFPSGYHYSGPLDMEILVLSLFYVFPCFCIPWYVCGFTFYIFSLVFHSWTWYSSVDLLLQGMDDFKSLLSSQYQVMASCICQGSLCSALSYWNVASCSVLSVAALPLPCQAEQL